MTFLAMLRHVGLWLATDKATELKKLTPEDRQWLSERAKIEYNINVTN